MRDRDKLRTRKQHKIVSDCISNIRKLALQIPNIADEETVGIFFLVSKPKFLLK